MRLPFLCIAWFASLALAAGEASPLPASTQKLVDDATAVALKARQAYEQTVDKEAAKLSAALIKEQERETKKGNLDGALAIKALIAEVQAGLLRKQADRSSDLLGDAVPGETPLANPPPAELVTDSSLAGGPGRADKAPEQLQPFFRRAIAIRLPKGEATPITCAATTAGTVVVYTGGGPRNAELWTVLLKAGFRRVDDGDNHWFVLNAKPGDRFTVFDPPGTTAQVEVYALRFKSAR